MPTGQPGEAGLTLHAPRADMSLIQGCVADQQAMSLHGAPGRTESQESAGSGQEARGSPRTAQRSRAEGPGEAPLPGGCRPRATAAGVRTHTFPPRPRSASSCPLAGSIHTDPPQARRGAMRPHPIGARFSLPSVCRDCGFALFRNLSAKCTSAHRQLTDTLGEPSERADLLIRTFLKKNLIVVKYTTQKVCHPNPFESFSSAGFRHPHCWTALIATQVPDLFISQS